MSGRGDYRLNIDIPIEIEIVFSPEGKIINTQEKLTLDVVNLSASGLSLSSPRKLDEGMSLKFNMDLDGYKSDVMARIVRVNEDGDRWILGCKFEALDSIVEQNIRKYIFNKEVSKRRFSGYDK